MKYGVCLLLIAVCVVMISAAPEPEPHRGYNKGGRGGYYGGYGGGRGGYGGYGGKWGGGRGGYGHGYGGRRYRDVSDQDSVSLESAESKEATQDSGLKIIVDPTEPAPPTTLSGNV